MKSISTREHHSNIVLRSHYQSSATLLYIKESEPMRFALAPLKYYVLANPGPIYYSNLMACVDGNLAVPRSFLAQNREPQDPYLLQQ